MAANVLFDQLGRQRNDRVYRERIDHLDQMRDEEVRKRYRFNKESIRFICNLLRDKLQQPTKRSQALSVELQSKKYKRRVQHKFVYQQAKQKNKRQVQQSEVAQPKEAEPEVAKQPWVETQTEEPEELQLQIGNNSRLTAKIVTDNELHQTLIPNSHGINLVHSIGIQHRVTTDLESLLPHTDILSIPNEAFIPNKTDHDNLFSDFQILIQRALVTFIPELKDFRDLVTFHIGHQYSKASEKKSDICFESAPFPLNSFEEAIGLFKNPPVVAINSITNLQDHHQRISIRGEITRYPQHNAQIQASIQMTDSSTQTDHIIIPQELLGSNASSQLTTVEEDEMSDSDDPEWVPSDEEEEIEGVIDINEQKNEAKEKKFIVFETELHDLFRECAKCRKTLTSEEIVKKK
ncbi:unnamed protein product [Mytilus edulis]|uniref:Uncharacterized protein n=1 Tax=Mytilus edulis TaxID=6550 RepID=A0A8S3R5I1_MYTED|nr:unnamed protein product [Mytilus edulis]